MSRILEGRIPRRTQESSDLVLVRRTRRRLVQELAGGPRLLLQRSGLPVPRVATAKLLRCTVLAHRTVLWGRCYYYRRLRYERKQAVYDPPSSYRKWPVALQEEISLLWLQQGCGRD